MAVKMMSEAEVKHLGTGEAIECQNVVKER